MNHPQTHLVCKWHPHPRQPHLNRRSLVSSKCRAVLLLLPQPSSSVFLILLKIYFSNMRFRGASVDWGVKELATHSESHFRAKCALQQARQDPSARWGILLVSEAHGLTSRCLAVLRQAYTACSPFLKASGLVPAGPFAVLPCDPYNHRPLVLLERA